MKQITLGGVNVDAPDTGDPDTRVIVIQELHPGGDTYILPLPTEAAEVLGNKLISPSVVLPSKKLVVPGA